MRHDPTPAEQHLWQYLRNRAVLGHKFRRQHPIDRFVVDFICLEAALIIEVDGDIHQYTADEDAIRQDFLESLGFRVIRFTNEQVIRGIDEVLRQIEEVLISPPAPSPQSGEGR